MSSPMPKTISDRLQEEARRQRRDRLWIWAYRVSVIAEAVIIGAIIFLISSKGYAPIDADWLGCQR